MDFQKELDSGWVQLRDLDNIVLDCRTMALKLGLTIGWSIKGFTATVRLRNHHGITWQQKYTDSMAHRTISLMYAGVHTELKRLLEARQAEARKMQQLEEERNREREVINMPTWFERRRG